MNVNNKKIKKIPKPINISNISIPKMPLSQTDKNKLLNLIIKTKNTIPLLTNEKLLENETKNKISDLTNRITWLTEDFQKESNLIYIPIASFVKCTVSAAKVSVNNCNA